MNPKVSVLVPIYNVEKYLAECLESVLAQKLQDIQIICINDGSTDSSLSIIEHYASLDDRIEIIDKPNSGYGASMNKGIDLARGEYIGIVESDDFADPSMFKDLYKYATKFDCDIVKSNYYEFSDEGGKRFIEPFARFEYKKVFNPSEMQDVMVELPIVWAAIYRRGMIEENRIRFNETPGASYQDTSFVHQAWMAADRAVLLKKGYLHYRVDNSASSVKSSAKVYAVCDEYEFSEEFMRRNPKRFETFAPMMNLLKLGTYRWNFNRLWGKSRLDFGVRMAQEFRNAREEGTLDRSYFCDEDWNRLALLMDNTDYFLYKYKDTPL